MDAALCERVLRLIKLGDIGGLKRLLRSELFRTFFEVADPAAKCYKKLVLESDEAGTNSERRPARDWLDFSIPGRPPKCLANSPLHMASLGCHTDICLLLLELRANPNLKNSHNRMPSEVSKSRELAHLLKEHGRRRRIEEGIRYERVRRKKT